MPTITAHTERDGSAIVTLDQGQSQKIKGNDLADARSKVMTFAMQHAERIGETVTFIAADPDGEYRLFVRPDGTREAVPPTMQPGAAVTDQRRPVTGPLGRSDSAPVLAHRMSRTDEKERQSTTVSVEQPVATTVGTPADSFMEAPPIVPDPSTQSFLTEHRTKQLAEVGWRGWLNRHGFKLAPAVAEQDELDSIAALCRAWDGPRTIVVANPKGGAGKTPVTIMLAALFGVYGDGSVLAWDNNDTRGTLGWRTETSPLGHAAHVRDLLPHVERLMATGARSGDLNAFVHRQSEDRFDVLRSTPEMPSDEGRLTANDFDAVHQLVSKYYRIIIVDTGNDETGPHWLRAIDRADQLVVATSTRSDRAEAARLMLNSLRGRDDHSRRLAENAVVLVSKSEHSDADPANLTERFDAITRAAFPVPYDPAIGADWLHIKPLAPRTRRAVLRGARAVAEGLG